MGHNNLNPANPEVKELLAAIGNFVPLDDDSNSNNCYLLRKKEAMAVIAAIASGRALIVRGEPGCGKTELATAVAKLIDRCLVSTTIQPETESSDLLWSIDHTQRLADAQRLKATEDIKQYLCAGPVWWALEPESATTMNGEGGYQPDSPDGGNEDGANETDKRNTVLLIDEIDKGAGARVADGLLEVMGHGCFRVPPLGKTIGTHKDKRSPLIIFTSNNTRDLPPAFLRRCVVLDCELPKDPTDLFCKIGEKRFPAVKEKAQREASQQIVLDRNPDVPGPQAGLAEYLDLLRALALLAPNDEDKQMDWLDQLAQCFRKGARNLV